MSGLIVEVVAKATLVLAIATALAAVARSRSAATRHFVWVCALVVILLVPTFTVALPSWSPLWFDDLVPDAARELWRQSGGEATWTSTVGRTADDDAGVSVGKGAPLAGEMTLILMPSGTATAMASSSRTAALPPPAPRPASPPALTWALSIWAFGATLVAGSLGLGMLQRRRLSRRARPVRNGRIASVARRAAADVRLVRPVRVLIGEAGAAKVVPMTWGTLRPVLYLPADARTWCEQRLHTVVLHELAHIKRIDSATRSLAQIACAVFWFHPLAWYAAKRMLREQERACDDVVLLAGTDPHHYAETLVAIAREFRAPRPCGVGALAFSRRSNLEHRVRSILDPLRRRHRMTLLRRSTMLTVFVIAVLPLAALRPQPLEPETAAAARQADVQATKQRDKAPPSADKLRDQASPGADKLRDKALSGSEKTRDKSKPHPEQQQDKTKPAPDKQRDKEAPSPDKKVAYDLSLLAYDLAMIGYDNLAVAYHLTAQPYGVAAVDYDAVAQSYDLAAVDYDAVARAFDLAAVDYGTMALAYDNAAQLYEIMGMSHATAPQDSRITVRAEGALDINVAGVDQVGLEPGGFLKINEGLRELEVRPDGGGVTLTYRFDGEETPLDDPSLLWANEILQHVTAVGTLRGNLFITLNRSEMQDDAPREVPPELPPTPTVDPVIITQDGSRIEARVAIAEPAEIVLPALVEPEQAVVTPLEILARLKIAPRLAMFPKLSLPVAAIIDESAVLRDVTVAIVDSSVPEQDASVPVVVRIAPDTVILREAAELEFPATWKLSMGDAELVLVSPELRSGDDLSIVVEPAVPLLDASGRSRRFDRVTAWSEDDSRYVAMWRGDVEIAAAIDGLEIGDDGELVIDERTADGRHRRLHITASDDGSPELEWFIDGEVTPFDAAGRAWLAPILEWLDANGHDDAPAPPAGFSLTAETISFVAPEPGSQSGRHRWDGPEPAAVPARATTVRHQAGQTSR